MTFIQAYNEHDQEGRHLFVGLDPDVERIPKGLSVKQFLFGIIEATQDIVAGYKPNIAFFEGRGEVGIEEHCRVIDRIRCSPVAPYLLVIGDQKRGDIANSNKGYAEAAFDYNDVDALTFNPYFGEEAYGPFFADSDKMLIAVCRTSNPGADEFQKVLLDKSVPGLEKIESPHYYYQYVGHRVANCWEHRSQTGLVVGATQPEDAAVLRRIAPDTFFLLPGIGDQNGDLEAAVRAVMPGPFGLSASGAVLYASDDPKNFREAAREVARSLDVQIRAAVDKAEADLQHEEGLRRLGSSA